MLGLPPSVRIYFAERALDDCAKSIDALAHVGELGQHDPFGGHLFVFVGKAKDRVKILFWDRSGFVLYMSTRSVNHVAAEPGESRIPVG